MGLYFICISSFDSYIRKYIDRHRRLIYSLHPTYTKDNYIYSRGASSTDNGEAIYRNASLRVEYTSLSYVLYVVCRAIVGVPVWLA